MSGFRARRFAASRNDIGEYFNSLLNVHVNFYDTNGSDERALLSMLFFFLPPFFLAFFALVFTLLTVDRFRLRAMCVSE